MATDEGVVKPPHGERPSAQSPPVRSRGMLVDWLPPLAAGFVAVLVGFTSSAVIVFQAAAAAGATPAQIGSWIMALGLGMAVTCVGLSGFYRMPIVTAWSTPGAALLATSLVGVPMSDAIGAFVFCGLLILVAGATGWFERVIDRIPAALAAALLAGVLARFGIDAVAAVGTEPALSLLMCVAYLAGRRWLPRYAVILVLAVGVGYAAWRGMIEPGGVVFVLARPEFVMPTFSLPVLIGVGLPLFVVTMVSQNVPGAAVLRASGYAPPVSVVVGWTGAVTLLLAPFGAFALNLAAITAAICCGPQAHEDPAQRYRAAIAAGVFYLAVGLLGTSVALLLAALPRELVVTVAGLALLATIGNGLAAATADERWREPALITFLVTLSGVTLFSVGAAFWGVVAGAAAAWILGLFRR
jgi:benzoate membrane transport protein